MPNIWKSNTSLYTGAGSSCSSVTFHQSSVYRFHSLRSGTSLHLTRLCQHCFGGQLWGNFWETGWTAHGHFQAIIEIRLYWNKTGSEEFIQTIQLSPPLPLWKCVPYCEVLCDRYTKRSTADRYDVYAILLKFKSGSLILGAPQPSDQTVVSLLGFPSTFPWEKSPDGMVVTIPTIPLNELPCQWAWVLKLTNIQN